MTFSGVLFIIATLMFAVAFVVFAFVHGGNAKIIEDCSLLGLAFFAAGHIPYTRSNPA